MEYTYKGRDDSQFNLTDVSELKYKSADKRDGLYKIIWAMDDDLNLGLDGYRVFLQKNHMLFVTPLNELDLDIENKDVYYLP